MPENFWEDIEKEAELEVKEYRATKEKLAGTEDEISNEIRQILEDDVPKEVKEKMLNSLRRVSKMIVDSEKFDEIIKHVSSTPTRNSLAYS